MRIPGGGRYRSKVSSFAQDSNLFHDLIVALDPKELPRTTNTLNGVLLQHLFLYTKNHPTQQWFSDIQSTKQTALPRVSCTSPLKNANTTAAQTLSSNAVGGENGNG
ncbi:hypothetical protein IscW_ISCW004105 [Ixodes scapularis]|uniref:Uncharacterized protein n=1 Tax=Ixodes scapularis TaxID=6945 RepID=B7PHB0_IXOSC|nr:hypothetical protein IscW_ISCW004105 [Ixodes scapularis]|eukprot:XP_002402431.1 hypothetical protein IscW_ISCW004105 [Ixodes scapularis]